MSLATCPICSASTDDRDRAGEILDGSMAVLGVFEELERARRVIAVYRRALGEINDQHSGVWGRVAHEAIREADRL